MADRSPENAPSLGRDALAGRLQTSLDTLEGRDGPSAAWRRAWLLTAAGRYGEALTACSEAEQGSPLIAASGHMARAMLLRQVALHDRAEVEDEQALEILKRARGGKAAVRAAIRVGLVADAVGLRLDDSVLSRRLKVAAAAVTTAGSWRQRVRLTWVRGEVDMLREHHAFAARAFAAGAKIASEQGARRHEAKSLIFLAAARAACGEHSEAKRLAERGLQLAARCGAPPLMWPAELILAEVDAEEAERHLSRARSLAGALIDSLPEDLRAEALQRQPASWLLADQEHLEHTPLRQLATDA